MDSFDMFQACKDFVSKNGGGGEPLRKFISSLPTDNKKEKEFKIIMDKKAASLICTFIRRSIFEQYERNMSEAGFTPEQNKQITYDTIEAFEDFRKQIIEQLKG